MEDLLMVGDDAPRFNLVVNDGFKILLSINEDGELIQFDNELCRELSDSWDQGERGDHIWIAKCIISVLDEAAKNVDPWLEGGGDLIREFELKDK